MKRMETKEIWMKVTNLYRFDEYLNIKSTFEIADGYEISNLGRLRHKGKVRNNKPESSGYIQDYLLCKNGKRERFKRHQIVMFTFNPNTVLSGYSIDHINRNRADNSLSNLRWADKETQVSNRDNKTYKYKKVVCSNDLKVFDSCQDAEQYYGLPKNTVSRVARGERKTIHNYKFSYV